MISVLIFGGCSFGLGYLAYLSNNAANVLRKKCRESVLWPTTTGKIVDLEIREVKSSEETVQRRETLKGLPTEHKVYKKDITVYMPKVRFKYVNPGTVGTELYSSVLDTFRSTPSFGDKFEAQNYLDNLGIAKDKEVAVYYNPEKKSEVSLIVGKGPVYLSQDSVTAFCIFGTVVCSIFTALSIIA